MGHAVLKSPSSAVVDAGLRFRPADWQQRAGAFAAVNGLYGGHCVWFEGRQMGNLSQDDRYSVEIRIDFWVKSQLFGKKYPIPNY